MFRRPINRLAGHEEKAVLNVCYRTDSRPRYEYARWCSPGCSLEDKASNTIATIAFLELAPDSGAATGVEQNQRSPPTGCCMTGPWLL